jgi:hypothetical protein
LQVAAIRCGANPCDIWDMTIGEMIDKVDQFNFQQDLELEKTKSRHQAEQYMIARILHDLPIFVNKALLDTKTYPTFEELLPDDLKKQYQERNKKEVNQEEQKKVGASVAQARVMAYANAWNKHLKAKQGNT